MKTDDFLFDRASPFVQVKICLFKGKPVSRLQLQSSKYIATNPLALIENRQLR